MRLQDDVQATFSMVLLGCYKSLVEQHCFAAFVTHTRTHTAHTSSSARASPFFFQLSPHVSLCIPLMTVYQKN